MSNCKMKADVRARVFPHQRDAAKSRQSRIFACLRWDYLFINSPSLINRDKRHAEQCTLTRNKKGKTDKQKRYNGKQETQLCIDTVHCGKGLNGAATEYCIFLLKAFNVARVQVVHVKNVLRSR